MAGTTLPELKELGGWRSLESVLVYAHLATDHLLKAASRIEKRRYLKNDNFCLN